MAEERVAIVAQKEFSAGGVQYALGVEVTPGHLKRWNSGDLQRRLEHGFVSYETVASEPVVEDDEPEDPPEDLEDQLEKLTKEQISAKAEDMFGKAISLNQNKDSMIAEYLTLKAEAEAATEDE